MSTTLLAAETWAQQEFALAELGDARRSQRLVKIATRLANVPSGTLPQAFADWTELKAAYSFFGQAGVTHEGVQAAHVERTRQACRQPGEYLLIEDTTSLNYSRRLVAFELGPLGDHCGKGFELHTALAVRVEAWNLDQRPEGVVVGLFDQQCRRPRSAPVGESRRACLSRPRKSQAWAAALKSAGRPPVGSQWVYVADRESDCYEPLQRCQQHGVDFVIRASWNRRLAGAAGHLEPALAAAPVLGVGYVELRSRGKAPARTVTVEFRSVRVDLDGPWRPTGWQPPLANIGVVEVREVTATGEPLRWVLLTSLPCQTLVEAQRVAGRYTARWLVEEYHKALKSGTGVEASQLSTGDRLEALVGVLAVVAVRLLNTKQLARSNPESAVPGALFDPQILALLEKKMGAPPAGWSHRSLLRALARVGGFIGRKSDGEPGWQTIWRGWQRLMWMAEGANLIEPQKRCG